MHGKHIQLVSSRITISVDGRIGLSIKRLAGHGEGCLYLGMGIGLTFDIGIKPANDVTAVVTGNQVNKVVII